MTALIILAAIVAAIILITKFYLRGENLTAYDVGTPVTFDGPKDTPGQKEVEQFLLDIFNAPEPQGNRAEKMEAKRAMINNLGLSKNFDCEYKKDIAEYGGEFVAGEWTIIPGADPARRLLYIHGGAFTIGSDVSHRGIIYNIAKRTGCVVFAPDYRLMPENKRLDSLTDSQTAYQWILENGPNGPAPLDSLAVAGDSAGGNLTLAVINWARDKGLRAADAVVALSPAVDSTFSGASIKGNLETDVMLKPIAGMLAKVPNAALLWMTWLTNKVKPSSKLISPIFDDLSNLPPTLVHASDAEILYDDARRYAEKRRACGSPVTLQTWAHQAHVWQTFYEMLPEGVHALDEIGKFMRENGAAIPGWETPDSLKLAGE